MAATRLIGAVALWVAALAVAAPAVAGEVDVLQVEIRRAAAGSFDIDVTLRHADTGWDHYANRWEVLGPDGRVLATRVLYHPHVNEQPFTRSLSAVAIPAEFTWIRVRGHDLVHGHGGREVTLSVPQR
ncbi:MAG: hypothetical protein QNJ91_15120 [Gammaproteobacteria bacterium]|nr:hypothetical protein [Gammaproteobacteria bacterium]